ncbi:prolyl oligopeptidase [Cladochytrium replicatum]|nr:prolyl oligopeptidase [Cladochytrium replicatum]
MDQTNTFAVRAYSLEPEKSSPRVSGTDLRYGGRLGSISRHNSQGADLTGTPLRASSRSTPPAIDDLSAVNAYVNEDPTNLVRLLLVITTSIEQFCLTHPKSCDMVWSHIHKLLTDMEAQSRAEPDPPKSPVCESKPKKWTNVHGEEWQDDFGWLENRDDPKVLAYIEAENAYSEKMLSGTRPLQRHLYNEFVSRLDENAETASVTMGDGYNYYSRKVPGEEYRCHCRSDAQGNEEVYLDENKIANSEAFADASFFRLGFLKHSRDNSVLAYGVDSNGSERYTVYFMDMNAKRTLEDTIEGVYDHFEFSNDNTTVYYTLLDDCERAYQAKRHRIGTAVENDEVLFHETDDMFYLTLTKTCDAKFIIINTAAQVTSETQYISANDSNDQPHVLIPRRKNVQYSCEHHGEHFYLLTNEEAINNWIFRIPVPKSNEPWEKLIEQREIVIDARDFVIIEDMQLRKDHLIVFERSNCMQNVRILQLNDDTFSTYHYVSFSDTVYSLWPGAVDDEVADLTKAMQFDTNILRFTYSSFTQPKQVVDYNMDTREMTVVHEEKVAGSIPYDQAMYTSKRMLATGVDGTAVPVSLVYRRDLLGMNFNPPQPNPVLLHGYGAYGAFVNPVFSATRLSLLDRGFIYAVAHVRGGADMGNAWYEGGKLDQKPNTFYDFISVAEFLIKEGYTTPEKLGIYGRSAGGLLIGAVINMRPDLFRAALTEVPFVDVINTMFRPELPWVQFELEEWGGAKDIKIYEVMKGYCPYTNIQGELLAQNAYPHLLVVAGMHDPRVAFFEPLKFVAKMRAERRKYLNRPSGDRPPSTVSRPFGSLSRLSRTGSGTRIGPLVEKAVGSPVIGSDSQVNEGQRGVVDAQGRLLLLKIDDAGHGGNSGQYSYLEDLAFEYAFLITSLAAPMRPIFPSMGGQSGQFDMNSPLMYPGMMGVSGMFSGGFLGSNELDKSNSGGLDPASRMQNDAKKGKRKGQGVIDMVEEKEYRSKTKGDRGQNRLFQWVANFF